MQAIKCKCKVWENDGLTALSKLEKKALSKLFAHEKKDIKVIIKYNKKPDDWNMRPWNDA